MNKIKNYDLLIIGGGISGCVFLSNYLKHNTNDKIALIEAGRSLGGRSSTRFSNRYKGFQLNHGSPNLNIINNKKNYKLEEFIKNLLKNNIIQFDDSDFINLSRENKVKIINNSVFSRGTNYTSTSSMSDLSKRIIEINNLNSQVDFYFNTLIVKLEFNKKWIVISQNGEIFQTKFLVCSSNLLLHKRSMKIFKTNQVPLRQCIPENKDKKFDLLFKILNSQSFIKRISFLIYTKPNYQFLDSYSKRYRYFYLNKDLENNYKFERVLFNLQKNNNLGIVIQTKNKELIDSSNIEKTENKLQKDVLINFNNLFKDSPFINQLTDYQGFSIMRWRASQPLGKGVPNSLQICQKYKIGFCGDWFDEESFGRVEGAILSGLELANKFNLLN